MKNIILVVLLLSLSACANTPAVQKPQQIHLYDYRFSLADNPQRDLTTEQVAAKLSEHDVIFFGEMHNHPGIHLAQMELLSSLYKTNSSISLSMEQFERDTQPILEQYMKRDIGEEHMIQKARAWPNYRSSYRPLVEFARDRQIPVIAANAPKQMVVCVGRSGLNILDKYSQEERKHVAQHIDNSDGAYRKKFFEFMHKDSPHKTPAGSKSNQIMQTMSQRSFTAQAVRDDTMAESIARHLQNNPGRQVLHLNGHFHSSGFLGAVERLKKRMPELKIAVIHPLSVTDNLTTPSLQSLGTVLIQTLPTPGKFVNAENRNQWMRKMMEKRMESRKKCPE